MQAYREMEEALSKSVKYITNTLGDCPFGLLGYYMDCGENCNNNKDGECWKKYFMDNTNNDENKSEAN